MNAVYLLMMRYTLDGETALDEVDIDQVGNMVVGVYLSQENAVAEMKKTKKESQYQDDVEYYVDYKQIRDSVA